MYNLEQEIDKLNSYLKTDEFNEKVFFDRLKTLLEQSGAQLKLYDFETFFENNEGKFNQQKMSAIYMQNYTHAARGREKELAMIRLNAEYKSAKERKCLLIFKGKFLVFFYGRRKFNDVILEKMKMKKIQQ
ncbi:MAG: hypothetical protein R6U66_04630 [Bacteroidales bacterium]